MEVSEAETQAVVHAFLTRLVRDREAGRERPLADYLALWPEFAEVLRGEIAALDGGHPATTTGGSAAGPTMPATFGPYRIDGVLGSGGQGTVYAAHDPRLRRDVALKVLTAAATVLSPVARDRFRREALTASRLDDPGLCTLLEAGEHEGQPYIAMRRIAGVSMAQWITVQRACVGTESRAERRRQVDRLLLWFESLARALHKAHLAGVVHRDLKPGNLMVENDERLVVLDFGLAAMTEGEDHGWTLTGDVIGTPAYLPPECLHGGRRADARTDVYALAATLYEALALRKPYERSTRAELYRAIEHEPVPPLRQDNPHAPADLQLVLDTALEKDPERRYASMLELADDLRRVRERQPIRARPLPRWLRLMRWAQRNPAVAAASAVAAVAVAATVILLLVFASQLHQRLQHTRSLALAGESSSASRRDATLSLLLGDAAIEVEPNHTTVSALYRAVAEAREVYSLSSAGEVFVVGRFLRDGRIVLAGLEGTIRVVPAGLRGAPTFEYRHASYVRSLEVDAAGERLVTASHDGTALLLDLASGRSRELRHPAPLDVLRPFVLPECLATFEPRAGGAILTGAVDGARLWPPDGDAPMWCEPNPPRSPVCQVRFAPDGRRFAVGRMDGGVRLYRWPDGALEREIAGPSTAIRDLAFSPDGGRLAVCQEHDVVRVLDAEGGQAIAAVPGHGDAAYRAAWSPDGRWLATCGAHAARICDADGRLRATCPHDSAVISVAFAPDSRSLLTATVGADAWLWSTQGQLLATYHGHSASMTMASFSADGSQVLSAGWDSARLWRTRQPEELAHDEPVLSCRMSADDSLLAVGLHSGEIVLHDRAGGVQRFAAHRSRIWDLWFTPDGSGLLSTSDDGWVKRWDLQDPGCPVWATQPTTAEQEPTKGGAFKAALAPDGRRLAVAHSGGISEFDLVTGRERRLGLQRCLAVAYDAAGERLAAGDELCDVYTYECGSGRWLPPLRHSGMIDTLAYAPDRDLLAVGTLSGEIVLWGGREQLAVLRHDARVTRLAFSGDGSRLLSCSVDGSVALWDVATRERQATLLGHQGLVWAIGFCDGGERVFSGGSDGCVRQWPATLAGLLELARARAWRGFSAAERAAYGLLPTDGGR